MELEENIQEYLNKADDIWWRTFNDDYWNKRIYTKYGKELGKEVGIKENQLETAKKMISKGEDYKYIEEITGLSVA